MALAYGGRKVPGEVVDGPWAEALSARTGKQLTLIQSAVGVGAPGPITLLGDSSVERVAAELGLDRAGRAPLQDVGRDRRHRRLRGGRVERPRRAHRRCRRPRRRPGAALRADDPRPRHAGARLPRAEGDPRAPHADGGRRAAARRLRDRRRPGGRRSASADARRRAGSDAVCHAAPAPATASSSPGHGGIVTPTTATSEAAVGAELERRPDRDRHRDARPQRDDLHHALGATATARPAPATTNHSSPDRAVHDRRGAGAGWEPEVGHRAARERAQQPHLGAVGRHASGASRQRARREVAPSAKANHLRVAPTILDPIGFRDSIALKELRCPRPPRRSPSIRSTTSRSTPSCPTRSG